MIFLNLHQFAMTYIYSPWIISFYLDIPQFASSYHDLPQFPPSTMIQFNLPWFTSIQLNLQWFTSIYHALPICTLINLNLIYNNLPQFTMINLNLTWFTSICHALPELHCSQVGPHGNLFSDFGSTKGPHFLQGPHYLNFRLKNALKVRQTLSINCWPFEYLWWQN